jgi:hypothetical protein
MCEDEILCEIIGAIIGDGHIHKARTKGSLYIYGHPIEDRQYLIYLSRGFKRLFNITPKFLIRHYPRGDCGMLVIHNKELVNYLTDSLGLRYGNKIYNVEIPKHFLNYESIKYVVRGIFDTDGSIIFTRSKNSTFPTYPRVEIKTSSEKLANQLLHWIDKFGFRVHLRKDGISNIIYLSGSTEVKKWFNLIGTSNPKHKYRFLFWDVFGYHIPRSNTMSRLKMLKRAGRVELPSTGDHRS